MKNNKQQFLPTLFDRLIDDHPKERTEPFDKFYFDSRRMRAIILRDIGTILNSENIERKLEKYKNCPAISSIVNYGIAPVTGAYATQYGWDIVEEILRNALLRFETRIIAESLVISPILGKNTHTQNGIIIFDIRALIHWNPYPLDLAIKGLYDIETQKVNLTLK